MIIRTYSELKTLKTFEERYNYLRLDGEVGKETFGFDRYLNQLFYSSDNEWKALRKKIIIRDNGCDLGVTGYDIYSSFYVHHMNTITKEDILTRSKFLLDPEYLITTQLSTHNNLHYGIKEMMPLVPLERTKNDTCPWRR